MRCFFTSYSSNSQRQNCFSAKQRILYRSPRSLTINQPKFVIARAYLSFKSSNQNMALRVVLSQKVSISRIVSRSLPVMRCFSVQNTPHEDVKDLSIIGLKFSDIKAAFVNTIFSSPTAPDVPIHPLGR
jgi:hypothetical protein